MIQELLYLENYCNIYDVFYSFSVYIERLYYFLTHYFDYNKLN